MDAVLLSREGWAARFKTLEDGRRQILNILLPGDIFDLQVLVAAEADHSVVTVTDGSLYAVAPAAVRKMLAGSGPLTMAFWWTQVQLKVRMEGDPSPGIRLIRRRPTQDRKSTRLNSSH